MSDSQLGAFRNLRVLWFPFSIPATLIGTAACVLTVLGIWLLQIASGPSLTAQESLASFAIQLGGHLSGFRGFQMGHSWGFAAQVVWLFLIWGTFGLAMARCMVLRLARDEYISSFESLSFGFRNARTALLFPVITVICLLLLAVINGLCGLAMQIPGVGILFYILLPIAWFCTAVSLLIALTATVGSGLVLAAIAAERQGTLDAWGKALNYVFARPIQFIIYIVLTKIFVIDFIFTWGVMRRLPHEWVRTSLTRFHGGESIERVLSGSGDLSTTESAQRFLFLGMEKIMTYGISGLAIASLTGAFVAMFLILRQDVDGIDTADIRRPHNNDPDPKKV